MEWNTHVNFAQGGWCKSINLRVPRWGRHIDGNIDMKKINIWAINSI